MWLIHYTSQYSPSPSKSFPPTCTYFINPRILNICDHLYSTLFISLFVRTISRFWVDFKYIIFLGNQKIGCKITDTTIAKITRNQKIIKSNNFKLKLDCEIINTTNHLYPLPNSFLLIWFMRDLRNFILIVNLTKMLTISHLAIMRQQESVQVWNSHPLLYNTSRSLARSLTQNTS